jgi:FkbM family methyltransferase
MKVLSRAFDHLRRLRRARRFGVPFSRRASFSVPHQIRLADRMVDLSFPPERGMKDDFLACFLDDAYGLSKTHGVIRTIVDIGGNVGFFSVAARSWFPEAVIHVYEPNPRIGGDLQANAAVANVRVYPEAVGASDAIVKLEDAGDSNQARTLPAVAGVGIRQVALAKVIERIGGQVDFAKIDCEGAEWDMLRDADSWKRIRLVRMEYHLLKNGSLDELRRRFQTLGFEIIFCNSTGLTWGMLWCENRRHDLKS